MHRHDPVVIPGAADGGNSKLSSMLLGGPILATSHSPTSFLSFGIIHFFDYSPSDDGEGAPHCGFDLHFSND